MKGLHGTQLLHGQLKLSIERTADGFDWELIAQNNCRIEPPKRTLRPVSSEGDAELLAEEMIETLEQHTSSVIPRKPYIVFWCRMYPQNLIRHALSVAKADYQ